MNFYLLLLVIASASLVQESDAFFVGGGFGGGFGFRRFGFGFRRFGFGRFGPFGGFGPFGPFGGLGPIPVPVPVVVPGPVVAPFGGPVVAPFGGPIVPPFGGPIVPPFGGPIVPPFGAAFGKRSVDEVFGDNETLTIDISTRNSSLVCHSLKINFECEIISNLTNIEQDSSEVFTDLRIEPVVQGEAFDLLKIVSVGENNVLNKFTWAKEEKPLALYFAGNTAVSQWGFGIKDLECWSNFEQLAKESLLDNVRVNLFISANSTIIKQ